MLTWIDRLFIASKSSWKGQAAGEGYEEGGMGKNLGKTSLNMCTTSLGVDTTSQGCGYKLPGYEWMRGQPPPGHNLPSPSTRHPHSLPSLTSFTLLQATLCSDRILIITHTLCTLYSITVLQRYNAQHTTSNSRLCRSALPGHTASYQIGVT